jgi:thioredoxin-dependent peroxiredoxin
MFERYTEEARRVLFFTRFETSQLGSVSMETEHLLLGLIREGRGIVGRIFTRSHVSLENIREAIEARTVFREKVATSVEIPFSAETKRVLQFAAEEADRLTHNDIGPEHLLLGILREEKSVAASILMAKGMRMNTIRDDIVQLRREQTTFSRSVSDAKPGLDMSDVDEHERRGEAFEGDIRLTVIGPRLKAGDAAPDFALDALAPGEAVPREITLATGAGRVRLIHVVNSLDTPVCHVGTRRFEQLRTTDRLPGVDVYTVSMDLPFAQARWRAAEGVEHETLSSHRSEAFGRAYGVLLREWRLLQRAVFVIDGSGRIVHAEYVADQMAEPDYDAAVAAARSITSQT